MTTIIANRLKILDDQWRSDRYIHTNTPCANINTVSGNVTYTPSSYLNTIVISVRTHMASGNNDTVPLKINLCTQWLSEYSCNQNTYTCTQWLY